MKLPTLTEDQKILMNALVSEEVAVDRALRGAMDAAADRHRAIATAQKKWWREVFGKYPPIGVSYNPRTNELEMTKDDLVKKK